MKKRMHTLKQILAVCLTVLMLLSVAPVGELAGLDLGFKFKAHGISGYSAGSAAEYAKQWWNGRNTSLWSDYDLWGGDCCNFVCQALYMGGIPMTTSWYFHKRIGRNPNGYSTERTETFTVVQKMQNHLQSIGGQYIQYPSKFQIAVGDVMIYDWQNDGRWDHCGICTDIIDGVPQIACHYSNSLDTNWAKGAGKYAVIKLYGNTCSGSGLSYDAYMVTASSLNHRSGPSTGYGKVGGAVPKDSVIHVTQTQWTNGKLWGYAKGKGYDGWFCLSGYANYITHVNAPSAGHAMNDWYTSRAATCTTNGEQKNVCRKCGYTETRSIAKTGHKSSGAATCTTASKCTVCGVTLQNALGHNWSSWSASTATCTSNGKKIRSCARCGLLDTVDTSSLGHNMGKWILTQPATCFQFGIETRKCNRCNYAETLELDMIDHTYEPTVVIATCLDEGSTTYKCAICGHTYISSDEWSDWTDEHRSDVPLDCVESKTQYKTVCWGSDFNDAMDEIGAEEGWSSWQNVELLKRYSESQSEQSGWHDVSFDSITNNKYLQTRVAEDETKQIRYRLIGAHESTFREWSDIIGGPWDDTHVQPPPTELYIVISKTVYRYKQAALGHNYQAVTVKPTCTVDGYTTYTCSRCGDTYSEIIAATGHLSSNTVPNVSLYETGDIIEFGRYPQTQVIDNDLILKLDSVEKVWVSYNYYSGTDNKDGQMQPGNWMRYADIVCDGIEYRAVTFDSYRPRCTYSITSTAGSGGQLDNGYPYGVVYYFKYEPLKWRVLDSEKGLILSDIIIDAQAYHNTIFDNGTEYYQEQDSSIFANDYAESSIRKWLNEDFYNTAFSEEEKRGIATTRLDNSSWDNSVAGTFVNETNDKVFLPSFDDMTNSEYGFVSGWYPSDFERCIYGSDYAYCQGLRKEYELKGDTLYTDEWLLRSPGHATWNATHVYMCGSIYEVDTSLVEGVRPALQLFDSKLDKSLYVSYQAPKCTESGCTGDEYCLVCGEVLTPSEEIPALGHIWGEWTDNGDGTHTVICERDSSHVETQAHNWNDGEITTLPTCTEEGVKTFICNDCGATKAEPVEPLGHTDELKVGDIITFGSYPQSKVDDAETIATLNSIADSTDNWSSYRYYSGSGSIYDGQMIPSDYMKYTDVSLDDGKYRGVYFSKYRRSGTGYSASEDVFQSGFQAGVGQTYQSINGYYINTIYWFKYEPIKWHVLDPSSGLIMADAILDSQAYNNYIISETFYQPYLGTYFWGNAEKTYYANNYLMSSIREWLNEEFYYTAFTSEQQDFIKLTNLDASAYDKEPAAFENSTISDKVFLVSKNDVLNAEYGFDSSWEVKDRLRSTGGSDYSKAQGLAAGSSWWLGSAGQYTNDMACYVGGTGIATGGYWHVNDTCVGVRPAITLDFEAVINELEAIKPTCTEPGRTAEEKCARCGIVLVESEEIPALGHILYDHNGEDENGHKGWYYVDCITDRRDCNREGCEYCEYRYYEDEDGHHDLEVVKTEEATCTVEGFTEYHCKNCDFLTVDKTEPLGHIEGSTVTVTPTCTEEGYSYWVCQRDGCKENYKDGTVGPHREYFDHVDAVGHALTPNDTGYADSSDKAELISSVPNTCGNGSVDTYQCTHVWSSDRCDYTVVIGEPSEHEMGEWYVATPATCEEPGIRKRDCIRNNDYSETEPIPPINHDWEASEVVPPTCEVNGYTIYVCKNDTNHSYQGDFEPALNHNWGNWTKLNDTEHQRVCKRDASHVEKADHVWDDGVVTIQPKAETPGEKTYTCTVCGAVKTEPIPVIGWTVTFKDDNGDALGTQTGATLEEAKGKQSDPTKDATAQYTYAFDHWDQVTANETTGEAAFVAVYTETLNSYTVTFKDENGDVLKTQTIAYGSAATAPADPAKGDDENKHYEFAGWDQDFSNITGNLTVTATYTGEAHISKEVVTVPATCEGEGTKQIVCEVCNRLLDTQTIDPLGHDWGAWSASGENHTRSCMRDGCNATQTEAHAWTKTGETYADCTNAGSITWRCDVCSAQKTETVDPNGHQLVKTEAVAATCLEDGNSAYYTCSVCGKFFSDEAAQNEIAENSWVIGALGHDWGEWTELNDNEHQRVCKRDASHKETASHVWNDGVVTKEPTCKEQGSKLFTCTVCDATKTEPIAVNSNNHADYGTHFKNAADATCLEAGYTGDTVCNGCGVTLTEGKAINPLGHDWGDWKTTTESTVYSGGVETHICKRDPSHKETRETDPLPSFEVTFVVGEETVQTVRVAKGAKYVEEPDLTAYQKDNKTVVWEEYTLNDEDITIHAIITEIDPNEVADGIDTEKTVDQFENGNATITLSASAPSRLVKFESSSTKPVDVIMVLDLSGSMDEKMGNQETKMQALKDCTNTFLNALNENAAATGADHRVALVGFASGEKVSGYSMTAYQNTGLIVTQNGGFVSYNDRSISNSYAKAWMPTGDALGVDARLTAAVNGLTAGGSTNTQLGLKMAQNILSTSSGDGREKIVLLITDGVPTVAGIKADEIRKVAPLAVTYANEIKNLGVKLYTVGVDADADENANFTAAADGVSVKNGTTTFDFNRFLNIVSSNYPGAKAMNDYGTKQNSGYYMSVNHTDQLEEIFTKVLYSSVYKKLNFQRCTLVDTLSKDFVLTMEQEQALKDNLAQQYNLSDANVMVRRNADGTTTLRIVGVPAVKCTENGKIVYRASVSFEAALAKYAAGAYATNTEDAYVEVDGERAASFDVPEKVTLNADRNIVVFTLNGTVYRIEEGNFGDVIAAPVSDLAKWNIPEGTEITSSYTVFEADEISTDTYTVTWSINGTQTTDSYHFGDAIQAPEVADLDDLAFAGFMPWVLATMPARNMTFTAVYAPKHTHAFAQTVVGNCKTDLRIVKTCACGETVVEAQPAREHQFSAVVDDLEGNTLTDTLVCSVCGVSEQHTLTFQTSKTVWGKTTVLDLSLEQNGTVIQPAAGSTIKIMVPWTNQGYTNTNVKVIRVNEQGVQKTYSATIENGYLVFYADHFSVYLVEELDAQGQETEPVSYKAAVCTLNGTHSYTDTVTPPTCKEKGYTTHTCASCGDSYTDSETPVAAHSLTHVDAVAATTEAGGNVEYYHCDVCGKNFSDAAGTAELNKVSTDKLQKPTEPEKPDDSGSKPKGDCKYCGETHSGPFGWLIKFFHSILALFGLHK